jgi:transposase
MTTPKNPTPKKRTPAAKKATTAPKKAPVKTGRPPLLTEKVRDALIATLRAGNYRQVAAEYAGIGVSTLYRWLERGETEAVRLREDADANPNPDETLYKELWEGVTRAEQEAEVRAVALWQKAMSDDWRAAKEYLARRHPDRWGDKLAVTGAKGGAVELSLDVSPSALLNKIKTVLGGAEGGGS